MRATPILLLLACVAVLPPHAVALTTPIAGAVAAPAGVRIHLPFPAGARVRVSSGYGPAAGSSLHRDTDATGKANDHYALDLVYADEADGGLGLPLVASMPGRVVRAGWATEGWANYGLRVILRHDFGDGYVYHSLYAHMNAIDEAIVEGADVAQGQLLGELGRSCMGALSCSSFSGPHVHWAVHRNSTVGGSGTGGSYGGNAVVPENAGGHEDIMRGQILVSENTGRVECGDGFCNGDETPASCAEDCPTCAAIPPEGRTVDDGEICFERGGDPAYWRHEDDGWDGGLWWTHATDAAEVDDFAIWRLDFAAAGRYRVEAYTDGDWAQSRRAGYRVRHAGAEDVARVDQSTTDGWTWVAEHDFAAGGDQWVRLDDNTGEPFSDRRQIVFDAIRITPTGDAPTDAGPPAAGDAGAPGDDAGRAGGDGGSPSDDAGAVVPGTDAGRPDGRRPTEGGGCGCRAGGNRPLAPWLLPAFALLMATRRTR